MGHYKLEELNEVQLKCIEMLLEGNKICDIEKELGVGRTTIWQWRVKNKLFIAEKHRREREISEFLAQSANKRFKNMQDTAINVLENLLKESKNDNVKKETAQYIIERNIGKIPSKHEVKDTTGEEDDNGPVLDQIPDWEEETEE